MSAPYDVLLRGAEVYDGLGSPPVQADIAFAGDRIAALGSLDAARATLDIDATGLSVAPGFIDAHTHDDLAALNQPDMGFKLLGGVTTCVVGNCGFGAAPFKEAMQLFDGLTPGLSVPHYDGHAGYAATVETVRPGVNIAALAGHGTLRLAAMGTADRQPEERELQHMKDALGEALDAGVFGLSSGLIYVPGRYSQTSELIELASDMRDSGALYATHMRDEGDGLLASVAEAIDIGEQAQVPVQISHHKASGRANWGRVTESLKLIELAQARGLDVHCDQYPYTAGSTILVAIIENGAFTGSAQGGIGTVGADDVVIAGAPGHPQWEGRTVAALAAEFGIPARAAALRVVEHAPGTTAIIHMMSEDDVQQVLRHPSTMIGSDGIPTVGGRPHLRLYNSFARVLGHYSRDLGVLSMADAIYRMTGFTANKFGLNGRGRIEIGAFADAVVFDAETLIDQGTFENPNRYPAGIVDVFVNGVASVRAGVSQTARAGRMLRRPGT